MFTAVFQVQKDGRLLHSKTVYNIQISKQSIQSSILKITGLNPHQYQAYYLDSEEDLIMTVVEEDYSIAQQTLDSDSIVFHIKVKVDQSCIKFSQQQEQEKDFYDEFSDEKSNEAEHAQKQIYQSSKGSDHGNGNDKEKLAVQELNKQEQNCLAEQVIQEKLIQQEEKIKVDDQRQINIKNEVKIEKSGEQAVLNGKQIISEQQRQIVNQRLGSSRGKQQEIEQINDELEQIKVGSQIQVESKLIVKELPLEKQKAGLEQQNRKHVVLNKSVKAKAQNQQNEDKFNQQMKNLRQNFFIKKQKETISQQFRKFINDPVQCQRFFSKFQQRLHHLLKPQCFIKKLQQKSNKYYRKSSLECYFCRNIIEKVPFYINRKHQKICEECQDRYDKEQVLTKIRSQSQLSELFTVKSISLLRSQLTSQDLQYFASISDERDWQRRIVEITLQKLLNQNRR